MKEETGEIPQATFTEQEVTDLTDFLNMMQAAKFDCNIKEAHRLASLHLKMIQLAKKIEAHIFEIKRVTHTKGE